MAQYTSLQMAQKHGGWYVFSSSLIINIYASYKTKHCISSSFHEPPLAHIQGLHACRETVYCSDRRRDSCEVPSSPVTQSWLNEKSGCAGEAQYAFDRPVVSSFGGLQNCMRSHEIRSEVTTDLPTHQLGDVNTPRSLTEDIL